MVNAPLNEQGLHLLHLGLVLFRHGLHDDLGLGHREPGQISGNAHDLLLIQDHTVGLSEHRLEIGMEVFSRRAVAAADELRG